MDGVPIAQANIVNKRGTFDDSIRMGSLQFDSRRLKKGEIFVVIDGEGSKDRYEHIEDAIQKGSPITLISEKIWSHISPSFQENLLKRTVILSCKNSKKSMGLLASAWRERFSIPVFGVTGSNGKTTTKDMLGYILSTLISGKDSVLVSESSFNNDIGLPLTLSKLKNKHKVVLLEMGTNHFGELAYLSEIAKPNGALITNIGDSHLEFLSDRRGVWEAKKELIEGLRGEKKSWFVNYDDPILRRASEQEFLNVEKIAFSRRDSDVDYYVRVMDKLGRNNNFGYRVRFSGKRMNNYVESKICFPGLHNIQNAAATFAIAVDYFQLDPEAVVRAMEGMPLPPNRAKVISLRSGAFIFSDCYNANPSSMEAALQMVADSSDGNFYVALGELLEMGVDRERRHQILGQEIARSGAKGLGVCGTYSQAVAKGAMEEGMEEKNIFLGKEPQLLLDFFNERLKTGSGFLLVKGSRGARMERLVDILVENQK